MHRCVPVVLALLVLVCGVTGQGVASLPDGATMPDHWMGPGPIHKVLLSAEELRAVNALRASGAVRMEVDYGSFLLFLVDEQAYGGRDALAASGLPVRDEYALIPLNGRLLDGTRPDELLTALPADERLPLTPDGRLDRDAGLYLVQFVGPVHDDWLAALRATGVSVVQYMPMNAYVVAGTGDVVERLSTLGKSADFVQHLGVWEPGFRMTPTIRQWADDLQGVPVPITVQLVDRSGLRGLLDALAVTGDVSLVRSVGPYVNVDVDLDAALLPALARQPQVFAIEQRGIKQRLDERQGQIVAGNISGSAPSGPGFLAWLASQGFDSSQFGSFSVNVVDDATSLTGHADLASSRIDFALNPTSQSGSQGGHGFLNAHIVAGLNSSTGSAFEDAAGYQYGLGIAPWAHVGSSAIFGPGGASISSWESSAYNLGARISSNSWSFIDGAQNPIPDYDSNSQEVDGLVRDARSSQGGNQEYMIVFAAGNDGFGGNTVSTPSTGKNILTVGAAENNRQTGTDGCGVGNSGANSVHDIISFSSQGPVNSGGGDGRYKPEIVAPGTHIQAGVPQSNYNGTSVCNQYFPGGQTLYGWSSGTSHSTPAVAGGAALVRQWFLNNAMPAPSPAMNKAVLMNGARYMTGAFANDTLPSNAQGMGSMDLGNSFASVSRILVDQTTLLGGTGATYVETGSVADPGQPFRVTLVWTDAPGPTTGAPWVNDLDLTVMVGGQTYRGNVFSGASSVTGGSADFRNNNESVFLPAGQSGAITVTVSAASIGGDGVPGNGDSTDQDFALVITNGTTGGGPTGPFANFSGTPLSGLAPLAVNFTDSSAGTIDTWSWDFGDTTGSAVQSPSHSFTNAGSYTVSLTVTGPSGSDTNTKVAYVTVTTPPPPGVGDGSFELQSAGAVPASPWGIAFGTGHVISPSGVSADNGMPADGSQWCELAANSTNNATPPSNPGGVTNPPVGGAGISQSFTYTAGLTELNFSAAFLRNEDPSSSFNDWMSVDVTDGSTTLNLYYKDTFSATAGTSSKYGYAMTPVEAVTVDLATLFPSSTTSTLFTLTALVGNGTDDIQDSKGYLDDVFLSGAAVAPVAAFSGTPLSGTAPLLVNFSDLSTGSVTSWSWSFGDTTTSIAQNPNHTYTSPGTYTVSLTATGPGGSDGETKVAYIVVSEPAPVAEFSGTPLSGTAPLNVAFSDLSTGSVTSWMWGFGDTTTSTAQNPNHLYTSPGTYTVSLTATGPGGSDGETKVAYITVTEPAPVAEFSGTPTSGNAPLLVNFSDLSTGSVTSWSWSFGDTTTSTAQNPTHTYTSPGTYTVILVVTGPGGTDAETKFGYVVVSEPAPAAEFSGTPLSGTAPLNVAFSDLSTGSVTSWMWGFGDTTTSTAQNPNHIYTSPGTYTVSLTATGPGGSDGETKVAYVVVSEPAPVADFSGTPLSGIESLSVNFTDLSSGGLVTSWAWTFGDTTTSTAQNPSHTYTAPGTYTVSLTATGPGGSDIETKVDYVTITPDPFTAYGAGSGGAFGVPLLDGTGDLTPGSATGFTIVLSDGAPSAPVLLFVGLSQSSLPFMGHTLLAFPFLTEYSLGNTLLDGTLTLPGMIPVNTPPVSLYLQAFMQDASGVQGLTSSNGLRLDIP
jgi:PKD repeat protein